MYGQKTYSMASKNNGKFTPVENILNALMDTALKFLNDNKLEMKTIQHSIIDYDDYFKVFLVVTYKN